MKYAIVDFHDGTEIVPLIWLGPDKKKCKWPPYTDKARITEAISKQVTPPNDWETYEVVKIHTSTATLDAAILELKCAEKNSVTNYNVQAEKQETAPAVSAGKKETTMYAVVDFDDGTEIVPLIWLEHDKKKCKWPPYTDKTRITEAITKRVTPPNDWETYEVVRIRATIATLDAAILELKCAEKNSVTNYNVQAEKQETAPAVSAGKKDLGDQNNPTLSLLDTQVKGLDDLTKLINTLMPMVSAMNVNVRSLEKRISEIEKGRTKPLVQQDVTKGVCPKKTVLLSDEEQLKSLKSKVDNTKTSSLKSVALETKKMVPEIKQNVATKDYIKKELPLSDKYKSEPFERKSNCIADLIRENNTKPLLPVVAPKDEKEDHLIKMTEKLLLLQTETNKSMNLLGRRISTIEENITKPVVHQYVTTRYDTKEELPVRGGGKLPIVQDESICTTNLKKSVSVKKMEMEPTVKQASYTPLHTKGDWPIVKKENLPSSYYQTDNTLPKSCFEEWNDPYSGTKNQWSTFTERKSRAEGAESYRWNNSSDFEMIRGFQYFEAIRQRSSPSVYLRTTKKHDNFVCQPVASQPVTALPGIGPVLGGRLASAGYSQARQVLQKFKAMGENSGAFQSWLHSICNANSRQSADCYYGLCDWKQNSHKYY